MTGAPMVTEQLSLHQRGDRIAVVSRWVCVAICLVDLAFVWNGPRTRPGATLVVTISYAALNLLLVLGVLYFCQGAAVVSACEWRTSPGRGGPYCAGICTPSIF